MRGLRRKYTPQCGGAMLRHNPGAVNGLSICYLHREFRGLPATDTLTLQRCTLEVGLALFFDCSVPDRVIFESSVIVGFSQLPVTL